MDYKNGKVYQILNTITDDAYIGSTCQPLSKRMAKHRVNVNQITTQHRPLYVKMKEIGVDNFYIELLEECPCDNKEQLRKKEGQYIREIGTLNCWLAGRTLQEYKEDNKDKIKQQICKYKEENKDRVKQQNQTYAIEHKDEINKRATTYYHEHKARILEKNAVKITCECGSIHRLGEKSSHLRTKKHIDRINLQNQSTST